jgi:hypothetical protein
MAGARGRVRKQQRGRKGMKEKIDEAVRFHEKMGLRRRHARMLYAGGEGGP